MVCRMRITSRSIAARRGATKGCATGGRRQVLPGLLAWLPLTGGALPQQRNKAILRHRLAEQEALAEIAAHAGEGERVGGLFDSDWTAALPKLWARSITVLQSGALTLSVPQSATKARSSFSSANGSP